MTSVRKIKSRLRTFIDSFYCRNIPSKKNIGSDRADNWFVLTDQMNNSSIVYSGGVGKDIYFEMNLAKEYGCEIFLFDPSPTGMATISAVRPPSNIKFFPKGLAGADSIANFDEPINPKEGSYRLGTTGNIAFECRSLSSLFNENRHKRIELLKIDIEGFEYEVIDDVLNHHLDIRQIVVEFHGFYKNIGHQKTVDCIAKLKTHGYRLYHKRGHDYSFVKVL